MSARPSPRTDSSKTKTLNAPPSPASKTKSLNAPPSPAPACSASKSPARLVATLGSLTAQQPRSSPRSPAPARAPAAQTGPTIKVVSPGGSGNTKESTGSSHPLEASPMVNTSNRRARHSRLNLPAKSPTQMLSVNSSSSGGIVGKEGEGDSVTSVTSVVLADKEKELEKAALTSSSSSKDSSSSKEISSKSEPESIKGFTGNSQIYSDMNIIKKERAQAGEWSEATIKSKDKTIADLKKQLENLQLLNSKKLKDKDRKLEKKKAKLDEKKRLIHELHERLIMVSEHFQQAGLGNGNGSSNGAFNLSAILKGTSSLGLGLGDCSTLDLEDELDVSCIGDARESIVSVATNVGLSSTTSNRLSLAAASKESSGSGVSESTTVETGAASVSHSKETVVSSDTAGESGETSESVTITVQEAGSKSSSSTSESPSDMNNDTFPGASASGTLQIPVKDDFNSSPNDDSAGSGLGSLYNSNSGPDLGHGGGPSGSASSSFASVREAVTTGDSAGAKEQNQDGDPNASQNLDPNASFQSAINALGASDGLLRAENESLKKEIEELKKKLAESGVDETKATEDSKRETEEVATVSEAVASKESESDSTSAETKESSEDSKEGSVSEKDSEPSQATSSSAEPAADKNLVEESKTLSDEKTRLTEENEKLVEEKSKLVEENSKLSEENRTLTDANSKLADENKTLSEENSKLLVENKELTAEKAKLGEVKAENSELIDDKNHLLEEKSHLLKKIEGLEKEVKEQKEAASASSGSETATAGAKGGKGPALPGGKGAPAAPSKGPALPGGKGAAAPAVPSKGPPVKGGAPAPPAKGPPVKGGAPAPPAKGAPVPGKGAPAPPGKGPAAPAKGAAVPTKGAAVPTKGAPTPSASSSSKGSSSTSTSKGNSKGKDGKGGKGKGKGGGLNIPRGNGFVNIAWQPITKEQMLKVEENLEGAVGGFLGGILDVDAIVSGLKTVPSPADESAGSPGVESSPGAESTGGSNLSVTPENSRPNSQTEIDGAVGTGSDAGGPGSAKSSRENSSTELDAPVPEKSASKTSVDSKPETAEGTSSASDAKPEDSQTLVEPRKSARPSLFGARKALKKTVVIRDEVLSFFKKAKPVAKAETTGTGAAKDAEKEDDKLINLIDGKLVQHGEILWRSIAKEFKGAGGNGTKGKEALDSALDICDQFRDSFLACNFSSGDVLASMRPLLQCIQAGIQKDPSVLKKPISEFKYPHLHRLAFDVVKLSMWEDRIDVIVYRLEFGGQCREVLEAMSIVQTGLDALENCKERVLRVFELLREFGNKLNENSSLAVRCEEGGGFSLKSLDRICEVKSQTLNATLLHFVVSLMGEGVEDEDDLLGSRVSDGDDASGGLLERDPMLIFSEADSRAIRAAKTIRTYSVYDKVKVLLEPLEELKSLSQTSTFRKKKIEKRRQTIGGAVDNRDKFHQIVTDFLERSALPQASIIQAKASKLFSSYVSLGLAFGDLGSVWPPPALNSDPTKDLFDIFSGFCDRVRGVQKELGVVEEVGNGNPRKSCIGGVNNSGDSGNGSGDLSKRLTVVSPLERPEEVKHVSMLRDYIKSVTIQNSSTKDLKGRATVSGATSVTSGTAASSPAPLVDSLSSAAIEESSRNSTGSGRGSELADGSSPKDDPVSSCRNNFNGILSRKTAPASVAEGSLKEFNQGLRNGPGGISPIPEENSRDELESVSPTDEAPATSREGGRETVNSRRSSARNCNSPPGSRGATPQGSPGRESVCSETPGKEDRLTEVERAESNAKPSNMVGLNIPARSASVIVHQVKDEDRLSDVSGWSEENSNRGSIPCSPDDDIPPLPGAKGSTNAAKLAESTSVLGSTVSGTTSKVPTLKLPSRDLTVNTTDDSNSSARVYGPGNGSARFTPRGSNVFTPRGAGGLGVQKFTPRTPRTTTSALSDRIAKFGGAGATPREEGSIKEESSKTTDSSHVTDNGPRSSLFKPPARSVGGGRVGGGLSTVVESHEPDDCQEKTQTKPGKLGSSVSSAAAISKTQSLKGSESTGSPEKPAGKRSLGSLNKPTPEKRTSEKESRNSGKDSFDSGTTVSAVQAARKKLEVNRSNRNTTTDVNTTEDGGRFKRGVAGGGSLYMSNYLSGVYGNSKPLAEGTNAPGPIGPPPKRAPGGSSTNLLAGTATGPPARAVSSHSLLDSGSVTSARPPMRKPTFAPQSGDGRKSLSAFADRVTKRNTFLVSEDSD